VYVNSSNDNEKNAQRKPVTGNKTVRVITRILGCIELCTESKPYISKDAIIVTIIIAI